MNRIYRVALVFWLFFFLCNVPILKAAETKKEVTGNLVEQALQLKQDHPELFRGANGVVVTGIMLESQGEKAGLQPGDILLSYDDVLLENAAHIIKLTKKRSSEESVVLGYLRRTTYQEARIHGGRIGVEINNLIKSDEELALDRINSLTEDAELYKQKGDYQKALDLYREGLCIAEKNQFKYEEFILPFKIGWIYDDIGQYSKALKYYEQALTLSRSIGDKAKEGLVLGFIGRAYNNLSQYVKALEYFEQSLCTRRSIGDKIGENWILHNIGNAYRSLSQYAKALDYYEQALIVNRAIGNKEREGRILNSIGLVYNNLSQYAKALEYYEQSLTLSRSIGDKAKEGLVLGLIGRAYNNLSQYVKALEYFEQSLCTRRSIGDKIGESWILHNIGIAYSALSQYAKALEYYEQSLTLSRAIGNKEREGGILNSIGNVYSALSQYAKALEYYEQALSISRAIGDKAGKEKSLHNIGCQYTILSQYTKALEYGEQALTISRSIGDKAEEGKNLILIGIVYAHLSQYAKALDYYEQALIVNRAIGDKEGEKSNLNNIGNVYKALSQYAKALQYYEQSLTISRAIGDKAGEGKNLGSIGGVYNHLSQYAKALEYFEQSLSISRAIGDKQGESCILHNIGIAYAHLPQYAKALEYYEQALSISRAIGDKAVEGGSLHNIGLAYSKLSQYAKALEYTLKSLTIDTKIGSPESLWRDWSCISSAYAELNNPLAAIMAGKQAVNTLQSMRQANKNLQKEFRQSFLEKKESVYQELANLLIDQGRISEAEQVMTMLKEEEFFDFIRRDSTNDARETRASYTKAEQKWLEGYKKISQNLMTQAGELETLEKKDQLEPAEQQRITELEVELEKAEEAFIGILDGLDDYFTKVAADKAMAYGNRNLDLLADQQAQLAELGHGAVLIHTVTTKEKLHLLLTTPEVSLARLSEISEPELNRLVKQFREVLQNPQADPLPLARKLYDILVRPVEQDLAQYHAKTLMWSLDGTLRYIPIAALHDGKNYLIEKYPVVLYTAAANNKLLRDSNSEWQLAGLGVSKQYGDYSPLPAVPGELNGIVKKDESDNIGVIPGVVYLNEQFDQSHFKSVLKQGYPVLHIATHFSLKPGDSSASHLLLGDGNILSLEEFRMRSAYRMTKVDLLTLSACNTAMGDKGAGGEVESFGALAQKQGAAGVLATLWPVADASTGLFMQELYRLRGADNKMTKVEALAQVQQNFIRSVLTAKDLNTRGLTSNKRAKSADLSYRHPYYWAPFILMGNWL